MGEYDQKTLKKLQQTELEIYEDFAKVCTKHHIPFFVFYGTALGAVRHQGFIPWDDDMDVAMLREDYERFAEVAQQELGDRYDFLTMGTVDGYVLGFAKLSQKGTIFVEETDQDRKYQSGIFIDIFPLDKVPQSLKLRKKIYRSTWIWGRLAVLSQYPKPKLPIDVTGITATCAKIGCLTIHYVLKLLRLTQKRCNQHYLKASTKYHDSDTTLYANYATINGSPLQVDKRELFPLKEMPYENTKVLVPNKYHEILTRTYGNYMELPPVEKQRNHKPARLEFGPTDA